MLKTVLLLFLFEECCCFIVKPYARKQKQNEVEFVTTKYGDRPKHFDWREKNMVSPVKDQLHCAACWAFSAIGNLESHLKIYKGMEVVLSEQFLIDCDGGCKDKNIRDTFSDITKMGGIVKDSDYYPYSDGAQQCRYPKNDNPMVPVTGYHRVDHDEELMAQYLYDVGPLSAGINAYSMGHGYEKGTIDQPDENRCSHDPAKLDHAILIVGYSVYENETTGVEIPYWIIKNSWGVEWGDNGYYYLERGSNACGISHDVAYAIVV